MKVLVAQPYLTLCHPMGCSLPSSSVHGRTWETPARSLGQEDPLEKGMATHVNILAWRIPWTEEPGQLQSLK